MNKFGDFPSKTELVVFKLPKIKMIIQKTEKVVLVKLPKTPQSNPPIAYPSDPPSPAMIVKVDNPIAWSSEKEKKK